MCSVAIPFVAMLERVLYMTRHIEHYARKTLAARTAKCGFIFSSYRRLANVCIDMCGRDASHWNWCGVILRDKRQTNDVEIFVSVRRMLRLPTLVMLPWSPRMFLQNDLRNGFRIPKLCIVVQIQINSNINKCFVSKATIRQQQHKHPLQQLVRIDVNRGAGTTDASISVSQGHIHARIAEYKYVC